MAKDYEPHGEVLSSAGTASSVYGFTGEQAGNLVYLRARYYQAEAMRFASRDTFAGNPTAPASLNRWLYAFANAVNRTDPSGYYPGCMRDVRRYGGLNMQLATATCAAVRFSEIVDRGRNWLSLSQLYSDKELNGALSSVAGSTVATRTAWVMQTMEQLGGGLAVEARFGASDCYLLPDFRDSQFHNPPGQFDLSLWPRATFSNQIGHFLAAVDFSRKGLMVDGSVAAKSATMAAYVHGMVAHELSTDLLHPSLQAILSVSGSAILADYLFMLAVAADTSNAPTVRDSFLSWILWGTPFVDETRYDSLRWGNSLQDLRLTIKGYRFATWSFANTLPASTGADWLRRELMVQMGREHKRR